MRIFRKLVHIFAWRLVSRTSKQVSRSLGPLWQPGVYNDTINAEMVLSVAIPPACYRSLSGPSGPNCPRSVECPRKRGVSEGVSDGVSPGPFVPRAPQCPKSVPRVSPECQPKGAGDTPSDTPRFRGQSWGHSGDTSGPKGPRDSCSRPAGSQHGLECCDLQDPSPKQRRHPADESRAWSERCAEQLEDLLKAVFQLLSVRSRSRQPVDPVVGEPVRQDNSVLRPSRVKFA